MANPEHVEILKQGVDVWNKWRKENSKIAPDFARTRMVDMDLSAVNLSESDFTDANLYGTNLQKSNLAGAIFDNANLSDTHLQYADLRRASLFNTDLIGANLDAANLTGARLRFTTFNKTMLNGADFKNVQLLETNFTNTDLSSVVNLINCEFLAPCNLDLRTIRNSGPLPVEFLHGVGTSDYEIEFYKLQQGGLTNAEINDIIYKIYDLRAHQSIQISPLFISYNHSDAAFVDEVGGKLTEKGVRFWRDVYHSTSGNLEKQVDHAMRLNDTVLLVLSKESTDSDWVEYEVTKARKLEKEKRKDVLCPVALDDSWKTCNWSERLRLQIEKYSILDFSQWQNEDVFNRQFSRLVDGLNIYYK